MTLLQNIRRPFPFRQYNIVFWIIGVNILVFVLQTIAPRLLVELAMMPALVQGDLDVARMYGALRYSETVGKLWQPLTYMFVHFDTGHLLFNSLGLYFFGSVLEKTLGSIEFLLMYLITGLGAGLGSLAIYFATGNLQVLLAGSSGAVFAVLFLFAVYYPDSRITVFFLFPVRAKYLIFVYTAISLLFGIGITNSNTAHLTHLFGFVFAYVYAVFRLNIPALRRLTR